MSTLIEEGTSGQSATTPDTSTSGNAPASGAASTGTTTSWRDSLPDDIKSEPSLASFKDVGMLAKSYIHAQSIVGKKGVVVPTDKDDDSVWNNFYKSVGVPDLDKYEIAAPKDVKLNEAVMGKFKEAFQKNGILPKQASAIVASYVQYEQEAAKAVAQKKAETAAANLEGLKRELGSEGLEKEAAAARVAAKEVGPEFVEYLKKSGLADDPILFKGLAKLGKMMGEDKLRGEAGSGGMGKTKEDIQNEINALEANPDYLDPMSKSFILLNQKRTSLYKQLYPSS